MENIRMKLKDWADREGIAYITAYRWFKAGKLPVNAYQADSGTIIVEDEMPETSGINIVDNQKLSDSPVSQLIKKAVEISKAGAPVEDLATFIISNFKLEKHEVPEVITRRARMKPTKEMTEGHFKKFLKSDKAKPEAKMFLVNEDELDNVVAASEQASAIEGGLKVEFTGAQNFGKVLASNSVITPQVQSIVSDMNTAMQSLPNLVATPKNHTSLENGAIFYRTLGDGEGDLNSTLSAANTLSSVSILNTPKSYVTETSDVTGIDINELLFTNEVKKAYHPVTYDEARNLVKITHGDLSDPYLMDSKAKKFCSLDRDSFDLLLKLAQGKK